MTWTWTFADDGQKFEIYDSGDAIETVENNRGVVNGTPPDVRDVVADRDMAAVLKDDIERR